MFRKLILLALGALLVASVAKAAIDGSETSMQRQQVSVGQLQVGMGTGTASSNAVTINNGSGIITTESLTTAGQATVTITLTNNRIAANDIVLANLNGNGSAGTPVLISTAVTANTATFIIKNDHASTALNAALKIMFVVIKSGNSN